MSSAMHLIALAESNVEAGCWKAYAMLLFNLAQCSCYSNTERLACLKYTEVAVAVVVSTLDMLLAEIHTTLGTPTMPGALLPEIPTTGIPPTGSHHLSGVMHTETVGVIDLGVEARHVPDTMTRMLSIFQDYTGILLSCLDPGSQLLLQGIHFMPILTNSSCKSVLQ